MRHVLLLLGSLMALTVSCPSQTNPNLPKKILTPEQQAYQQKLKEVRVKRDSLQAEAGRLFESEMAREKAGDCSDAGTTYDFNVCFGKAVDLTDRNLRAYQSALRDLLSLEYPEPQPTTGPAGPVQTPAQSAEEFDRVEKAWLSYLDIAGSAAFHQFGGGTGGPSAEMECHLRLVRNHMRELDGIYFMLLHK